MQVHILMQKAIIIKRTTPSKFLLETNILQL